MQKPGKKSNNPSSHQVGERLQSPHDRLINQTLQQLDAARALLARHLPREITQHLQLDTLKPVDTSFIDRNLRRRLTDRLFSVNLIDQVASHDGLCYDHIFIFVLIDHKSTDQPSTLVQMLGDILRIRENMLENRQPLVPIIPWVIYNGSTSWRSQRSLDDLIPIPDS